MRKSNVRLSDRQVDAASPPRLPSTYERGGDAASTKVPNPLSARSGSLNLRIFGALAVLTVGSAFADNVKQEEALEGALIIKSQDAVAFVPVAAETSQVAWVKSPIQIDGDLADWNATGIQPIAFEDAKYVTWSGRDYGGADDLSAKLRLGRDGRFLYVALEVTDDKTPYPSQIEIGIAPANSPLITTWRDVGKRYGVDDVHPAFSIGQDGTVSLRWAHVQERMDQELVSNAFGNEEERRAFIDQHGPDATGAKIFSKASRQIADGRSTTIFEVAFPWRMLMPYDPVSYGPLNFNFAVRDSDHGAEGGRGVMGWKPGLAGTYSAAHFATLAFTPPPNRSGVDAYAQLPKFHYLNEDISAAFSFYNHADAAVAGKLEIYDADVKSTNVLASLDVTLPAGYSRQNLGVHSEKLGKTKAALRAELKIEGHSAQRIAVHAPTLDETVTIQPLQEVLDAIAGIEANAAELERLYKEVEAKGLDTTYPMAYWTLQQMFIARCKGDMNNDSRLVLENAAYLGPMFKKHKALMEEMLRNPETQLKVPARPFPETLKIKEGFYYDGDEPVFLWGPCVFWWMKNDQHYSWKLGFNSVGPELPVHSEKDHPAIAAYLENFRTNGMLVNAAIGSSQFDALKKEHPEVANVDRNNFLSILIQHPIVREEIKKRIDGDIAFFKKFPGVRSYWLWNEPDYVNFSEMTRQDFIKQYLKPKYQKITELNTRWKSDFASFDDVQIPRGLDGENQAPWVDYQVFLNDLLADFFGFLHTTSKQADASRPTHTKYMCISAGIFDIEKLQGITDIAGHDGNMSDRDILFLDLCRSLYPEKPLVNTEIHIWYRDYLLVSLVPWRLALHGLADGNWWCWHANHRFSKTVGSAESMEALSIAGLDVRRLFSPYIHALVTKPKQVATLYQDVVAGRSWGRLDKLRYEIAPAQYALGIQPFYATEKTISNGVLKDHKVLIAAEATYVKDKTYRTVLKYVKRGGTIIVLPESFAADEYNVPRDTSELIPLEGGEAFGEGVREIALGKGRVICIDQLDGSDPGAKPDGAKRQAVYRRVLSKVLVEENLLDPVRLVVAGSDPDALRGMDIRSAKVDEGYVLCALPAGRWETWDISDLKLETDRPVKRIVDLITEKEVPVKDFKVALGANLFLIELE